MFRTLLLLVVFATLASTASAKDCAEITVTRGDEEIYSDCLSGETLLGHSDDGVILNYYHTPSISNDDAFINSVTSDIDFFGNHTMQRVVITRGLSVVTISTVADGLETNIATTEKEIIIRNGQYQVVVEEFGIIG